MGVHFSVDWMRKQVEAIAREGRRAALMNLINHEFNGFPFSYPVSFGSFGKKRLEKASYENDGDIVSHWE